MNFSIIIPVYNVETYVDDCLNSVLAQTYSNYEIICINDGSTDNSLNILNIYAEKSDKIKIISQENKGLSAARNAGIKEAKGDYIFLLDSDDWIEENTLKILAEKTTDEDMICFSGKLFYEDTKQEVFDEPLPEKQMKGWDYYNEYALKSRKFHFVCTVLRLYNREFLLKNNLFFEEGIYHEDNLFTPIACYYAEKVKLISDCLYVYRIREGSITQTPNLKRLINYITIANKLSDFFIPIQNINKATLYREIAGEYFSGFIPKIYKLMLMTDKELREVVNWENFKTVSVYPRHKRIYRLLFIHPILFRLYYNIENVVKTAKKHHDDE